MKTKLLLILFQCDTWPGKALSPGAQPWSVLSERLSWSHVFLRCLASRNCPTQSRGAEWELGLQPETLAVWAGRWGQRTYVRCILRRV